MCLVADSAKKCTVLADEIELTQCIEGLHKVCCAPNYSISVNLKHRASAQKGLGVKTWQVN